MLLVPQFSLERNLDIVCASILGFGSTHTHLVSRCFSSPLALLLSVSSYGWLVEPS